ncbi:MAG: 1-acyl-sn-glycerol-3-phosphate acyltransferase [Kiritimatiellae bacterium]|nr:1-acyl-sn-glycerol-3-phosphate acyltransferase [Kiritimatiellia bacterium]
MADFLRKSSRGAVSLVLFALFGLGGLLVAPVMLFMGKPERGQPVVRALWRITVKAFELTGLIRIVNRCKMPPGGAVIVANHPSLVDVVILVALFPRTLYVAKRGLRANVFLSAAVKATALPDDAGLIDAARPYLAKGWNVLVFPEGTRTPEGEALGRLKRGAAQLALRTGARLAAVRIDVSERFLGKHQKAWNVGTRRVEYILHSSDIATGGAEGESLHARAARLTEEMRRSLTRERNRML